MAAKLFAPLDLGGITLGYSPTNRIGSRYVEVTVIGSNGRLMK